MSNKVFELAKMIDHSILHPTLDDLIKMKEAGATRSGATATIQMLEDAMERFGNR